MSKYYIELTGETWEVLKKILQALERMAEGIEKLTEELDNSEEK